MCEYLYLDIQQYKVNNYKFFFLAFVKYFFFFFYYIIPIIFIYFSFLSVSLFRYLTCWCRYVIFLSIYVNYLQIKGYKIIKVMINNKAEPCGPYLNHKDINEGASSSNSFPYTFSKMNIILFFERKKSYEFYAKYDKINSKKKLFL